jgi:hypothetical protein
MAYHEAVHLGQELSRKMDTLNDNDDANDSQSSEGEQTDSKKLSVIFADDADAAAPEITGKFKKLFDMSFMKNAKAKQQEKAREDAMTLLQEIREMEKSGDGFESEDENAGSSSSLSKMDKPLASNGSTKEVLSAMDLKRKLAAKVQMESLFGSNKATASATEKAPGKIDAQRQYSNSEVVDAQNPWLSSLSDIDRQLDKKESKKRKKTAVTVSVPLANEEVVVEQVPPVAAKTVTNTRDSSNKIAKTTERQNAKGQNNKPAASTKPVQPNSATITVTMESNSKINNAETTVVPKKRQEVDRKPLLQQRSQV